VGSAKPVLQRLKPQSICCVNVVAEATTYKDTPTSSTAARFDEPEPAATKARALRREEELLQLVEVCECGV
jgi:hypothetical protein